jgi:hypothetical protein
MFTSNDCADEQQWFDVLSRLLICYVVQPMYVRKTGITRCRQYLVNANGRYYERPAIHLSGLRDCKTQLAYDAPHGLDSGYEDIC